MKLKLIDINDFVQTVKQLEALRHREIQVVGFGLDDTTSVFQGYDIIKADLDKIASVRIALSSPSLNREALFSSSTLSDKFEQADLKALRENVVGLFGDEIWPQEAELDTMRMLNIMDACNQAIDAESQKIIPGPTTPVSIRWVFEEKTTEDRINAVEQDKLIQPYERLIATLVHLIERDQAKEARIKFRSVNTLDEFKFAHFSTKSGNSLLLPEMPVNSNGAVLN